MQKTILIVEDELLIAKAYEGIIKNKLAARIFIAGDLTQAREIVLKNTPDIFLLDVNLKNNENGLDFAYEIRRTNQNTIVFTTGNANPEVENELVKIPNSIILLKPVNFDYLIKLLNEKL